MKYMLSKNSQTLNYEFDILAIRSVYGRYLRYFN